ncbi:MAG: RIP metalloprotease RseP [Candidatus Latescibacteria bacterium]|nr:RIP metalloprotease RseP [Candidatus Latescibacterota bacterium]NIM22139.1 RIP metalloprotease RseP [Candidatus Latescibacterota bacterium]NIM64689.1 RIP metalloprotease RseP [Candidatus Latescibacterota bacterium]NIO01199.1 RIP metalloprotease RseP [Candidatus Latescibacterota bacterium]NIO27584.1 RIP metalloprotease RseP [Candidatus Latescibacterota bacterium]
MLITIIAGAFVLGVVILVHEFGHFIVAKVSGVFVKTFSVGFGKKLLKKRFGDTQYALSALPFGGYVKFAGEVDESTDDAPAEEPPSGEVPDREISPEKYFRNKRVLIKSAVIVAGPLMNFVLAIFIYTGIYNFQGIRVIPTTTIGHVIPDSPADSCGLQVWDEILAIDGKQVANWGEVNDAILEDWDSAKRFEVLRGGEKIDIGFKGKVKDNRISLGFLPHIPAKIGQVKRDAPAYKAGMRTGAIIEAINDTSITSYYEIEDVIHPRPGIPLVIQWSFDGEAHVDTVVPEAKKILKEGSKTELRIVGQIGVGPYYERKQVGFLKAVQMGSTAAYRMTAEILSFLKLLFTGKAGLDSLGGPILITQMAGDMARWGFNYLLYFLAFFSINLCIFNLLPFLPFDGGHLVLFLYEGAAQRRVNRRVREILTQVGFALIILLMTFVVIMDISRCAGTSPGLF